MAYKVAIASSDGKVVNQHFGRTPQFYIFELESDGSFKYVETRQNVPPCSFGEHHEDALEKAVELVADSKVVLVSQIGRGAEQVLNLKGVKAFVVSDFIDKALGKLAEFDRKVSQRSFNTVNEGKK